MENQNSFNPGVDQQIPLPNASMVLILGIVSIVTCCCYGVIGVACGVIALILYNSSMRTYNANPSQYTPSSLGNLNAGRVCAIIGLILSALLILCVIGMLVLYGTVIFTDPNAFIEQMSRMQ